MRGDAQQPGPARRPSASSGSRRAAARSPSRCKPACRCWKPRAAALPRQGFAGGVLNMRGGALGPFAYVMPALSKTGDNAAFYSDTFRPAGVTRLKIGRDDAGRSATARRSFIATRCGPRPMAALTAAISCPRRPSSPSRSRWRRSGSTARSSWRSRIAETNFKLFGPVPRDGDRCATPRAAPLRCGCGRTRILPARWKRSAASAASVSARIHGGVGSTIGARFADGRCVEPFATELAIRSGIIASGPSGALEAELDIALVDYLGGLAEGRLMRGDNPVLMTMELVLEVV